MAAQAAALLTSLAYMLQQQQQQLEQQQMGPGGPNLDPDDEGPQGKHARSHYSSGICPDEQCQMKLYFPSHEASVECPSCGQRHSTLDIKDKTELKEKEHKTELSIQQVRQAFSVKKKAPELVKVRGISNYQCKLLSPLLTTHGRDSRTNTAKPLTELGMGDTFDCSKLANRAFSIEENQLNTAGYGRDRSGSARYLMETFQQLKTANQNAVSLVPVHADGDGHCLVHAISRCLVGRELFWHALRHNLYQHLTDSLAQYKATFKEFYEEEEWAKITEEAAPNFQPQEGEVHGLCNIHIFGLANVLRRPIVLLDSLSGMQSSGDYSGLFLPALHPPAKCCSKDAATGEMKLNSPIVVAWSNSGRNHFVPLVPIRGKPLPKLPPSLRPKVWGVGEDLLESYVDLDSKGCIELCGGKTLTDAYMQKLVQCMENLFFALNGVQLSVVADVHQYVFRTSGYVGVKPEIVVATTKSAVEDERLFRCLICNSITCIPVQWLERGGSLYIKATSTFKLEDGMVYQFPMDGVIATYNAEKDRLHPTEVACFFCTGLTRHLNGDGKIAYENGDRTLTPAVKSKCGCGYRHYWDGKEYDNLPEKIPLSLTWANQTVQLTIHWFQYESDPERNSNVYEVAQKAVSDHFPGEFGSERLVQQIVDSILRATERRENLEQVRGHHPPTPEEEKMNPFDKEESSKAIMTGPKSLSIHKEELGMSNAERRVKRRVEENARVQQRKKTAMAASQGGEGRNRPSGKRSPGPQSNTSPSRSTPSHPHPSPPSPTPGKPANKKIKVTSSDGRTANLTLDPKTTFPELQAAIEKELSIPANQQRLRWGFPPKELRPSDDPSHPVELANGERVSVDVIGGGGKGGGGGGGGDRSGADGEARREEEGGGGREEGEEGAEEEEVGEDTVKSKGTSSTQTAQLALDTIIQQLQEIGDFDLWTVAQHQPHFFRKGGDYYKQVIDTYGGKVKDHTHFQFREFPKKTFAFNAEKERLELCLGRRHIPIGPLSPEEEQLATAASLMAAVGGEGGEGEGQQNTASSSPPHSSHTMGVHGAISRSEAAVKAFSGRGQTLGSRQESPDKETKKRTDS